MYAATSWSDRAAHSPAAALAAALPPAGAGVLPLARAEGRLEVGFKALAGRTVLARLHQQGCAKARLPRPAAGLPPELVMINLAGGITGGDRITQVLDWAPGTHAVATTQAAEKIYRASRHSAPAELDNRLTVGARALAEWLPQTTILFDGARLRRRWRAELAADARLLAVEALQFGRTAMGETVRSGLIEDSWRIWRAGRLVFGDGLRLSGAIQATLDRPAVASGARALATVLYVGTDAPDLLAPVRAGLDDARYGAASRRGDLLVIRLIAADGAALQRLLEPCLMTLRAAAGLPAGLPKQWRC